MDGSQDGELTVMEGLPGLFNSSDSPMRLVFISRIPEVQAVMADIPFVAIGVTAIAFAVVLILIGRLTRSLLYLILAGASAFAGTVLSLTNIMFREWHADFNFPLTIATSIVFAFTVGFTAWYLCRRAEQPGCREQIFKSEQPPVLWPLQASDTNTRSSWSTVASQKPLHSGQWRRCGFTGTLLRALLYMSIAALLATEITWRIAFHIDAQPFFSVYYASQALHLFILAVLSSHLIISCFSKLQPTGPKTNLVYITPILFGNSVGVAVAVLALIMINFTETPLGRFLSAVRLFAYMTNAVIDELRNPRPDGFTAELFPRSIAAMDRLSQYSSQVPKEKEERSESPYGPSSPISQISGPLDLNGPPPPRPQRRDSVVKSWTSFPNSVNDSTDGVVVAGSAIASSEGDDSPLDKDSVAPFAENEMRRRRSLYRPSRPSSIFIDNNQRSRGANSQLQRSAEPLTSATLPSYRSAGTLSTSETGRNQLQLPIDATRSVRPGPRPLSPIRQASYESALAADQSYYSTKTNHVSVISRSTASTDQYSDFEAQNFPLPPASAVGDRRSRMVGSNSVLVDKEEFIFEPPRPGRFEQAQRTSELTLGSAGSIGESSPGSIQAGTPIQRMNGPEKNITSFIAPCANASADGQREQQVATPDLPQSTTPSSWRDSRTSGISELSEAQVLRAQSVIRASYVRYGRGR